ncbi:hypothetical protein MSPP1_002765 [Malassezia sp. CBS 17886]|nr:hypothetical protein MSPP1_002765 [Malassezia sp. CBS 17886]
MSTGSIPASLGVIAPFLQRATEVDPVDPVIAYWCYYYAAQRGIGSGASDPPAKTFLVDLMGDLEKRKAELGDLDTVVNDDAASAHIENFALNVFLTADNDDREGTASRNTARAFLTAATLLELLNIYGPLHAEMEEKVRYARWKAAQISKALREGGTAPPGPAGDGEGLQSVEPAVHGDARTSTGPVPPSDEAALAALSVPQQEPPAAPGFGAPETRTTERDAEIRAAGSPRLSAAAFTAAPLPSVPTTAQANAAAHPHIDVFPPHHGAHGEAGDTDMDTSAPRSPPDAAARPSRPPAPPTGAPQPAARTVHMAPPTAHAAPAATSEETLSIDEIARVQKLSRFASSALDYEDIATAREQLQEALAILDRAGAPSA